MINIKVQTNGMIELKAKLAGLADKQVAFATSRALNAAAAAATRATSIAMRSVFDRPTPWVMKSVRYTKSDKRKLTATVDFDFWGNKHGVTVAHVLAAEIHGGQRKNKRHEIALQRAGILPAGMGVVPGPAAKLDQYGNMGSGQIVQIMSWFQAFGEQGYWSNMRDGGKRLGRDNKKTGQKGFAYFALQKPYGKLAPGIYQRFQFGSGSAVKPVMFFVRMPNYKRRFDFYGIAERQARREFDRKFPEMLAEAMRTAR